MTSFKPLRTSLAFNGKIVLCFMALEYNGAITSVGWDYVCLRHDEGWQNGLFLFVFIPPSYWHLLLFYIVGFTFAVSAWRSQKDIKAIFNLWTGSPSMSAMSRSLGAGTTRGLGSRV
jgi:hypothetical protein